MQPSRKGRYYALAALGLIALLGVRLLDSASRQSFTIDEPHYVGTGLYLWSSGDYHFSNTLRFHPPLAFHLASVPLLAIERGDVEPSRRMGDALLESGVLDASELRMASRLPFILIACWGAVLVALWALAIAGRAAALGALFLYSFSPNLLAFGSLAHNDMLVSVLTLQTLFLLWRWSLAPSPLRLGLVGASLGLAMAAKISGLLLLGSVGLLMLWGALGIAPLDKGRPVTNGADRARRVLVALVQGGALLLVAILVLWASYGGSFAVSEGLPGGSLGDLRLPAYLHSLLFDVDANSLGRPIYLAGEFSDHGWWYFLPLAFLLKTPIATLLLLALAVGAGKGLRMGASLFLGLPIAIYAGVVCLWLEVPLGLRYLLPIIPLLAVWIACRLLPSALPWRRAAMTIAALWLAVSSAMIHPHYLAYFNEAAGGPSGGHEWMAESNLDWGQALPALATYLRARGNPPVHLAYFGPEDPEAHGIEMTPLRGCEPVEGIVAISVNILEHLYSASNPFARPPEGCYDWLREDDLVAQPGYAIHVYDTRRPPPSSSRPPNVIVYVVDTLRADRLSIYGYERDTSPELEARLNDAWVFEQAYAPSSHTIPSISALFAARVPSDLYGRLAREGPAATTLAEAFLLAGYRSAAFIANPILLPEHGYDRGFETYELIEPRADDDHEFARAEGVGERLLEWIDSEPSRESSAPFFAYIQTMDVHAPYAPPAPFDDRYETPPGAAEVLEQVPEADRERALEVLHSISPHRYDGAVAYSDYALGKLFAALGERGLLANTIMVVTSDHGEPLGQRGELFHGNSLHEEVIRVPLLIFAPGGPAGQRAGERSSRVTSLIDLGPTLLELAGLESPQSFTGGSWLQAGDANQEPAALGELLRMRDHHLDSVSLREGRWKLIRDRGAAARLYDVVADPREELDLAGQEPAEVERLEARIRRRGAGSGGSAPQALDEGLSENTRRKLQSALERLGYLEPEATRE